MNFKVISSTNSTFLGATFSCSCDKDRTYIKKFTEKIFEVVSILPSKDSPRYIKFRNDHFTVVGKVIN